jgi:hypothetical protein
MVTVTRYICADTLNLNQNKKMQVNFSKMLRMNLVLLLWCILCCSLTGIVDAGQGATLDGYTIHVMKSQKPAEPNILTKKEVGTFNFYVELSHVGTKVEAVPPNMTLVYQITSSDSSVIKEVLPKTYNAPSNTIKNVKAKQIYANGIIDNNVRADVSFSLKGKQTVTLRVSLIKNNDGNAVADSETIEINVVTATCTVYAQKPEVKYDAILKQPYCSRSDVGHSFWKISIDDDVVTANSETLKQEILSYCHNKFGHYPKPITNPVTGVEVPATIKIMAAQAGQIFNDSDHSFTHSVTFGIKARDALNALLKTRELHNNVNLKYHLLDQFARNCTGQCVELSINYAKCNAPTGEGTLGVQAFKTANIEWGLKIPFVEFRNPYHHAKGIEAINNAR